MLVLWYLGHESHLDANQFALRISDASHEKVLILICETISSVFRPDAGDGSSSAFALSAPAAWLHKY